MLQTNPVTADFRRSLGERLLVAFAGTILGVVTLFMTGAAFFAAGQSPALGLFLLLIAAVMAFLTWLVWREVRGAWGVRVVLQGDAAHLILPAQRGYVRQPAIDTWIPLASIAAVEAREEAFRSLGTTTIQIAYCLRLADGGRVILGADNPMRAAFYGRVGETIAAWARVPLHNLGLFDGNTGPAMVAGNSAPDWNAQPLDAPTAQRRRGAARMTWTVLTIVIAAVALVRGCSAFLGH